MESNHLDVLDKFLKDKEVTFYIKLDSNKEYEFLEKKCFSLYFSFLDVLYNEADSLSKNEYLLTSFTYFINAFYFYITNFLDRYYKGVSDLQMEHKMMLLDEMNISKLCYLIKKKMKKTKEWDSCKFKPLAEDALPLVVNYVLRVVSFRSKMKINYYDDFKNDSEGYFLKR